MDIKKLLLGFTLATFLITAKSDAMPKLDGVGPTVFSVDQMLVLPGQTVTFTMQLDGTADGTESIYLTSATGAFMSLPSVVHPSAGQSSITFTGVVGLNFFGATSLTAYNDVSSVSTSIFVLPRM